MQCRLGVRLFEVDSVQEEHFSRDVRQILQSKLCDLGDLFAPPGIQMPEA